MRNSDNLILLIKSLKTSEKSDFLELARKNATESRYIKLFHSIERTGSGIDDGALMRLLNYRSKNTFYVAKNYLFNLILKSLRSANTCKGIDDAIRNKLFSVRVLYEKTLFSKAAEILKKVKKTCMTSESYLRLLEVFKWERNLIIEGAITGNKFELLEKIGREEDNILRYIGIYSKCRLLSFSFNSFVREIPNRNKHEISAGLKYYKNHPLLKNVVSTETLASRITLLEVSASLHRILNKPDEVYSSRKAMISLIESNKVFKNENLTNYVISLYNLANTAFELGKTADTQIYVRKLRELALKHYKGLSANTKILLNIGTCRLEINNCLSAGNFISAKESSFLLAELVEKYKNVLTENEKTESLRLSITLLFLLKEFNNCMKLINNVMEFNSERVDLKNLIFVRFVHVLILFEKENFETAEYRAVSLTKYLNKAETSSSKNSKKYRRLKKVLNFICKATTLPELFDLITEARLNNRKTEDETGLHSLLEKWIKARTRT